VLTGNVVSLMRVVVDLERLAGLAPTMAALAELARAHLSLMRGRTDAAIAIYERVLETPAARSLFTYPMERALHVRALGHRGEYAAARALCLPLLAPPYTGADEPDVVWRLPRQELALIEAHLGNFAAAFELLDACLVRARKHDNPLALGSVHRDRARVHALAGDRSEFAEHLATMEAYFRSTENPWLIQQCAWLRANVAQLGLIEPAAVELPKRADGPDYHTDFETQTALRLETALEIQPRTTAGT
jgi:tetratricopeptide (TPR) repeat protein